MQDALVRSLLDEFLSVYVFQPATAFWRAIEIAAVVEAPFPKGRGLDLGCGDGKLTKIVDARIGGRTWVGVDLNPVDVALAKERGLYERLVVASVAKIPEPDASLDFVFANSVVEHVQPIDETLAEIARLLKPGGEFVNTVPSSDYHATLRGPLLPWVRRSDYLDDIDHRMAHLRYWSLAEWRTQLARHGLEITETVDYLTRGEMRRYETLVRMTSGVVATLFGRRKTTTQMQEALGLRRQTLALPAPVRAALGAAMFAGVDRRLGPFGGLYMRATKRR
ncbi:MAG: methyltransferase domain-containing protein [Deltaproteobacteria bacterium]|nr:methyltransferase domain-containing protein [Deltaproteobacteria bacterium]